MKLKWIFFCAAFIMNLHTSGQDEKARFSSLNAGGIIIGQTGTYGVFQTVNGFVYKKWFAGIGAGFDYYNYTSIPLFIDARRYLGKGNNGFLYADLGYNFPWKNKPGEEISFYSSYDFSGGVYTDLGVGYGIKFLNKTTVLISGGFSYKSINNRIGVTSPCLVPPCPESFSNYHYGFNRIILKAGIHFK